MLFKKLVVLASLLGAAQIATAQVSYDFSKFPFGDGQTNVSFDFKPDTEHGIVIDTQGNPTRITFTKTIMADTCNQMQFSKQPNVAKTASQYTVRFTGVNIYSTLMGCLDGKTVERKITTSTVIGDSPAKFPVVVYADKGTAITFSKEEGCVAPKVVWPMSLNEGVPVLNWKYPDGTDMKNDLMPYMATFMILPAQDNSAQVRAKAIELYNQKLKAMTTTCSAPLPTPTPCPNGEVNGQCAVPPIEKLPCKHGEVNGQCAVPPIEKLPCKYGQVNGVCKPAPAAPQRFNFVNFFRSLLNMFGFGRA